VLATAIDGRADAIVTGDADLRADDELRSARRMQGVALWGVNTLLETIRVDSVVLLATRRNPNVDMDDVNARRCR
jgi:hypothetical protein